MYSSVIKQKQINSIVWCQRDLLIESPREITVLKESRSSFFENVIILFSWASVNTHSKEEVLSQICTISWAKWKKEEAEKEGREFRKQRPYERLREASKCKSCSRPGPLRLNPLFYMSRLCYSSIPATKICFSLKVSPFISNFKAGQLSTEFRFARPTQLSVKRVRDGFTEDFRDEANPWDGKFRVAMPFNAGHAMQVLQEVEGYKAERTEKFLTEELEDKRKRRKRILSLPSSSFSSSSSTSGIQIRFANLLIFKSTYFTCHRDGLCVPEFPFSALFADQEHRHSSNEPLHSNDSFLPQAITRITTPSMWVDMNSISESR